MFELFLFTATPIVACITVLLKAFSTTGLKRKLGLFLISSAMAGFSFVFIYSNFVHIPHHCNCKAELEGEAQIAAAAIALTAIQNPPPMAT